MEKTVYEILIADIKDSLAASPDGSFAIIGHTAVTYDLITFFQSCGAIDRICGVYAEWGDSSLPNGRRKKLEDLATDNPEFGIVASDTQKEELIALALPYLKPSTRLLLSGYGHFSFRDPVFDRAVHEALVPSLANGYPHTLVHLYQCLQNAARMDLIGVVAEFGMFKGGTTMLLSRLIEQLGRSWRIVGFDTFAGFPPRRSVLDMYAHPGCVFHDEAAVRQYLAARDVEIVSGDIVKTASRLEDEDIVLAFIDTDNFTSATAVLDVIQDRVVVGGAIVFDHFTGRNRFLYTLGERIAAKRLLSDHRYFNLHDTGVFFKQR